MRVLQLAPVAEIQPQVSGTTTEGHSRCRPISSDVSSRLLCFCWASFTVAFLLTYFTAADPLTSTHMRAFFRRTIRRVVEAALRTWGLDRSLARNANFNLSRNLLPGDMGTRFGRASRWGRTDARLPATLELVIAAIDAGTMFGWFSGARRTLRTGLDNFAGSSR